MNFSFLSILFSAAIMLTLGYYLLEKVTTTNSKTDVYEQVEERAEKRLEKMKEKKNDVAAKLDEKTPEKKTRKNTPVSRVQSARDTVEALQNKRNAELEALEALD